MKYLFEVFAGDGELVGQIVVTGSEHDLAGAVVVDGVVPVRGGDAKVAILAGNCLDPFVLANV